MRLFHRLAIVACIAASTPAPAADLRVGLAAGATSIDPQFYVLGPNSALARNMFDALVNQDETQQIRPALALSWSNSDEVTWEFKLRPDVKFHDGATLSATDVVASLKRVELAARNSPSSFLPYVRDVAEAMAVDPLTVRIRTKAPAPLLLNNLSRIAILPAASAEVPTTEMNSGKGVIGTGPFRFVAWEPNTSVELVRHAQYWGAAPAWDKVVFRVITNNTTRVAALLAGDVDAIEAVPPADIARIGQSQKHRTSSTLSNRVMYLHMDQDRETSPFAAGPDGRNPLKKAEVRRALSLAINRKALIERIMDNQGEPAGQLVPKGYFGHSGALAVDAYDPEAARKALTAAGYPDGFTLTLDASNDRYLNDQMIAQALGQMFTRVGIKTAVETLPGSVFFTRASKLEFSMIMGGAAVETGEASGVLGPLLATFGPAQGQGNRGRYSSPAFDAALKAALGQIDPARRENDLRTAMEIGMKDRGVLPLFFIANVWATRADLSLTPRSDGYTLAQDIRTTKP